MKYHWRNGKTRLFHSKRSITITRDLFAQQATGISIAFWFLMHFLVSWCYTQLRTLELKLLSLPLRNGYIFLEFLNVLYPTEELLSIIPTSITGQNIWASLCDLEQHTHLGLMAKSKTRTNKLPVIGGNFWNDARNNWSSLAPKFTFAHNKVMKHSTGKKPNEIVFRAKPQTPLSLKLGFYRKKHKFCCSEFSRDLPCHSHGENNLKNHLVDNVCRPKFSQALLEQKRAFKRFYCATFERCREQTARSHAYRNWFKLGQHLEIG